MLAAPVLGVVHTGHLCIGGAEGRDGGNLREYLNIRVLLIVIV